MGLKKSWVESANSAESQFPLNNLPYGVYLDEDGVGSPCVAIGDMIVDLGVLEGEGVINAGDEDPVFDVPFLNEFMDLGTDAWKTVRARLMDLLAEGGDDALSGNEDLRNAAMIAQSDVDMGMPFVVGEYTDFYAGRNHAQNVGEMFRGKENALPPNWLHIPIGYNGRASTVVVSGTDFHRPNGQLKGPNDTVPSFGPCKRLDIELEMGAVVGSGNKMGQPVSVAEADEMIFGYVLLNDWSARDIQAWEYQPLGPFQAKVFATTISPWVVTKEALEPFRCNTPEREFELLPYLQEPGPMLYNIDLEVALAPEAKDETIISRTNYNEMYYSSAQQLAHHASSGCEMGAGDLLGSGTISGVEKHQRGALLEITWAGANPITLDGGETRTFLEDGDTVTLRGAAKGDGFTIGFGECAGKILPAVKFP
ncbi:fumarylacetoacetase [Neptunicoccus cionae]|uniref:fumarylacetoacetase n=1 Tax=Neptunicoccus cionae TaxID=2035344 RepID=A0A916R3N2_9RHOB|nr:fumarylacetoacetase [Amylibacter cionae]GGA31295.1 fumarylacetoacetase [Amylibacter cionae]